MISVTVDIGRSTARVRVGERPVRRRDDGDALGGPDAVARVARLVRAKVGEPAGPWRLAVAVPGALTHPGQAAALARRLGRSWAEPPDLVVVTSDVLAWHAGVFAGRDGVVLAVGTGSVALGLRGRTARRADGRGPLLGDEGSGAWLGLAGLRAAARSADGRGPATELTELTAPTGFEPAALATLAPGVLAAAERGDRVATGIVTDAVDALARTAAAAGGTPAGAEPEQLTVAVVGGLAGALLPRLRDRHPKITWITTDADALAGLTWLLDHSDSPLESLLARIRPDHRPTEPAEPPNVATEVDALPTEALRPGSEHLDELPTRALVELLVAGQAGAAPAVARASGALAEAVDRVAEALRGGGRMVYVGAGTPGRLAVQDAAELTPTFGLDPARVPTLLAGGVNAARSAVENAEDDVRAGQQAVAEADIDGGDVVVGISASGRTPFVRAALAAARERGAVTVAMVSAHDTPVGTEADIVVELLTGPEVLAGSTRLAAGTAQKIALNTLSTAAMVRLGATYAGWMVGLRPTNAKLRRRAVRIVRDAAGVEEATAAELLTAAGDDVRTALVSALTGLDADTARERLAHAGSVRAAVAGASS